jgi:hypothetical protein
MLRNYKRLKLGGVKPTSIQVPNCRFGEVKPAAQGCFDRSHLYILYKYYCGIFAQSKNCGARETAIPGERSETTFVSRQRLGKQFLAATDTHATIQVLLETVFSTRSVQRGYK